MKRNLCSSKNKKGFALITVTFMLVGLISLIFLTAYLPIAEQRYNNSVFLTDMGLHRCKQALFGRTADQCGGKFTSCGGYISDYQSGEGGGAVKKPITKIYGRRLFGLRGGTTGIAKWVFKKPNPWYYYQDYGFWNGYRGKRYLHPLPCDDWDEWRYFNGNLDTRTRVFLNPFGSGIGFFTGCGRAHYLSTGGSTRSFPAYKNGMYFNAFAKFYIIVKDYSKNKDSNQNKMKVKLFIDPLTSPIEGNIDSPPIKHDGYVLHIFRIDRSTQIASSGWMYSFCGLRKILIQIDGVTKFTTTIVLPPYCHCKHGSFEEFPSTTCRSESFSITIDYYG